MRALMTATAKMTGRMVGIIMAGSTTAGTVVTTVAGWTAFTPTVVAVLPPSTTACRSSGPPARPERPDRRPGRRGCWWERWRGSSSSRRTPAMVWSDCGGEV